MHTQDRHALGTAVVLDVQAVRWVCAHLVSFGEEGMDWHRVGCERMLFWVIVWIRLWLDGCLLEEWGEGWLTMMKK